MKGIEMKFNKKRGLCLVISFMIFIVSSGMALPKEPIVADKSAEPAKTSVVMYDKKVTLAEPEKTASVVKVERADLASKAVVAEPEKTASVVKFEKADLASKAIVAEPLKVDKAAIKDIAFNPPPSLHVSSNPKGAEVVVDGKYRGDAPVNVYDLSAGSHKVQCALPGYIDYETSATESSEVSCSLVQRQPPPTGKPPFDLSGKWKMVVRSSANYDLALKQEGNNISGSMTRTNGNESVNLIRGVVYPNGRLEFHRLKQGEWVQKYQGDVSDRSGNLRIDGTYEQIGTSGEYGWNAEISEKATGTISSSSNPSGADVLVDGEMKGKTPAEILVPAGTHTVRLRLPDYKECEKTVTVPAGSKVPVQCTLSPSTGNISVKSNPPGAEVFVDGASKGTAAPELLVPRMSPGLHRVLLKLPGHADNETEVNVTAGDTTKVTGSLSTSLGSINVISSPEGAEVLVNDTSKGTAPRTISDLAPGSYKVVCQLPCYKDLERNIPVNAGATTTINCEFIGQPSVRVVPEPGKVKPGEPSKIAVTVTCVDGSPLPGAEVELNSSQGGMFTANFGRTDFRGQFSTNFTAQSAGEFKVKASVKERGKEYQGETAVEISPSAGYGAAGSVLLAAAAILAVGGYLRARRRE
jgi:archaellum component FlaG (FlaF/FlaG flagellin family)